MTRALALAGALTAIAPAAAHATWGGHPGRIAFYGFDPDGHIFMSTIRPDGRHVRRLGGGSDPAWSPSGRRLAYAYDGVWISDASGRHRRKVAAVNNDRATVTY